MPDEINDLESIRQTCVDFAEREFIRQQSNNGITNLSCFIYLTFIPFPIVNWKSPMSLFERQTAFAKRSDVKSQSGANIKETWQIRQGFLFL